MWSKLDTVKTSTKTNANQTLHTVEVNPERKQPSLSTKYTKHPKGG